jgi:putative colanic acid biosynthesis acetyltransferase WcaF
MKTVFVRQLSKFTGAGYEKGRSRLIQALWVCVSALVIEKVWCPARLRVVVLRIFGARVGKGVLIRHGVRVHWPWKLTVGDDVWIGVDVWLLNLEPIDIGSNVCISQAAFLCTGSHRADSPSFEYDNAPIRVCDGAWIAAKAIVLRGVTVGRRAVVGAGALVVRDVPEGARALAPKAQILKEGELL